MKNFDRAQVIIKPEVIKAIMKETGMNIEDSTKLMLNQEIYMNDVYQVLVRRNDPNVIWLSIKRLDREPIDENHWRILREIKNLIVGPDYEGMEMYPAEGRLVDESNQYHLFVLKDKKHFPFGYTKRSVYYESGLDGLNTKQRGKT